LKTALKERAKDDEQLQNYIDYRLEQEELDPIFSEKEETIDNDETEDEVPSDG
jgi:hypothetical protein